MSCRSLVDYAAARSHPTAAWLKSVGLTGEQLEDPEARLGPKTIFALWRHAYAAMDDPALALHVAESLPRGAYRAVEYLAEHSPTIGKAYAKVVHYFSVIDATTELVIEMVGDRVGFGPRHASDPSSYPAIEYMLAACYLRVREMTGTGHRPIALAFTAPAQTHGAELERVFGCKVRWNADADRLFFALDDWNHPTAHADPAMLMVLEDYARLLKKDHPSSSSLLQTVDQILEAAWDSGPPSLDATARQLGMSPRTLQRRLGEEGTAFSDRMDEARRRATLRWLRCHDLSLAEVAYLVGFQEQASLTRAVKRWTGQTPGQFRRAELETRA